MERWGDESIFLSTREATRCAIGRHGVAFSQKLNFQVSEEIIPPHIENAKLTRIIFKLDAPDVSSNQSFVTLEIANEQAMKIDFDVNNIASIENLSNEQFAGNWVIDFGLTNVPGNLKNNGFLNPEIVNNIKLILIYEGEVSWVN